MTLYPKLILDALATVRYPGTGKNLVEATSRLRCPLFRPLYDV